MNPVRNKFTILKQICNIIPPNLVSKLAKKHGVDKYARTFSPWSQVVSMLYCHIARSVSLNNISDALKNFSGVLIQIRHATPPSKSGLSYANKVRNADIHMALDLQTFLPRFAIVKSASSSVMLQKLLNV